MRLKPTCAAPKGSAAKGFAARSYDDAAADAAALAGIAPRDAMETVLLAGMITVHTACMDCYRRAHVDDPRQRHEELRNAVRLTRAFVLLVDALHRYRGAVEADFAKNFAEQPHTKGRKGGAQKFRGTTPCNGLDRDVGAALVAARDGARRGRPQGSPLPKSACKQKLEEQPHAMAWSAPLG
jgi:hypothetical protein